MLKRRTKDRKAVVATRPDIALAVFKDAVEFYGWCFIDRCILRFFQIHRPNAIRAGGPEAAFAVCKEPGMGYWKAAVQSDFSVLIGIQKRCVVIKGIEFASGLGEASGAESAVSEWMHNLRADSVFNVLKTDNPAREPEFSVPGLEYLIIGVISFRISLVVPASGLLPDAILVREFQQQCIPDGSPDIPFGIA